MFTIQNTFNNLKIFLFLLGIGVVVLCLQIFHLSQYAERFDALKQQHQLIDKIITMDFNDPQMASILIGGASAEIALSVKKTGNEALFDFLITSGDEKSALVHALNLSSENFRNEAAIWSESLKVTRDAARQRMINAKAIYLQDINEMMDYHTQLLYKSIAITKITAYLLFPLGLILFLFYRSRLNRIYYDIDQACSVDIDGSPKEIKSKEIDFLVKRLSRKAPVTTTNALLIHPQSGILNEKGMMNAFNIKKSNKAANTLFVALFDIDQYAAITRSLSKEDLGNIYRKFAEILSMYEQTLDIVAQLDNDRFLFLFSRNSKDTALDETQRIVDSVKESVFVTAQGTMKLTLSAGFLLKAPVKSLDEIIVEAGKLVQLAQESGGNRVAQLRHRSDSYN